jgi:hypothetical protein
VHVRLFARRPITHCVGRLSEPPLSFGPAESLQVEAVPVVELDAFLFQQALLEGVAAMARECVGHLALRVDDAMPGNIGRRVKVLEYIANKAGAPWQAGPRGDLAIGGNPALGNAADYRTNRRGDLVAWAWGGPVQRVFLRHPSSDSRGPEDTLGVAFTITRRSSILWGRRSYRSKGLCELDLLWRSLARVWRRTNAKPYRLSCCLT